MGSLLVCILNMILFNVIIEFRTFCSKDSAEVFFFTPFLNLICSLTGLTSAIHHRQRLVSCCHS